MIKLKHIKDIVPGFVTALEMRIDLCSILEFVLKYILPGSITKTDTRINAVTSTRVQAPAMATTIMTFAIIWRRTG